MANIYYEDDATEGLLDDKKIAVIGYGSQGRHQALNMKDSGLDVIIGNRPGKSAEKAKEDGFDVYNVDKAAAKADIIHVLIPDEIQSYVYEDKIKENLQEGNTLMFSHGFNICFNFINPPENVDVIMVAPKGPGVLVRQTYVDGFGTPALIAVEQDFSGKAKDTALTIAKALGAGKAGVLETTFAEETETDLFGEQVDLCGGVTELIRNSFETLVENGYQPEVAYFETLHELKLITDLIQEGGIEHMYTCVSNTAEYGGRTRGPRVIDESVRERMEHILEEVQDGSFAEEWMKEYDEGLENFEEMREKGKDHQIEKIGSKLRKMFSRI